jgi:hypothetical protein
MIKLSKNEKMMQIVLKNNITEDFPAILLQNYYNKKGKIINEANIERTDPIFIETCHTFYRKNISNYRFVYFPERHKMTYRIAKKFENIEVVMIMEQEYEKQQMKELIEAFEKLHL